MKRLITVAAIAISLLTLLAACGSATPKDDTPDQATLSGAITIGPACPVEPCDESIGNIYEGRELVLSRSGGSEIRVPLGEDGSFSVSLEPSTYEIRLDACDFLGCDDAFPVERTVAAAQIVTLNIDLDTGIRAGERGQDIASLVSDLEGLRAVVTTGDGITQPFFSVQGLELIVDGEAVQVFNYSSPDAAGADADTVSESGSPIGTTMVSWVAPPHFYLSGSLLVLYVGNSDAVVDLLETVLGPQFAGGSLLAVVADPSAYPSGGGYPAASPDSKFQAYLALLKPEEVADLSEEERVTATYLDHYADAASVDQSQVEHMDSFASLTFTTMDGSRTLVLTLIDFNSESAATDHVGPLLAADSGMHEHRHDHRG